MSLEHLFSMASTAALLGWVMLAVAPLQREWSVNGARMVVAVLCGGYAAMLITGLTSGNGLPEGAGFNSLAAVHLLLSTPEAMLAGWVHYLAFDLFIGAWQTADAPGARIPHWLLLPCLAITLFAGPVGLLLYLVLKASRRRQA